MGPTGSARLRTMTVAVGRMSHAAAPVTTSTTSSTPSVATISADGPRRRSSSGRTSSWRGSGIGFGVVSVRPVLARTPVMAGPAGGAAAQVLPASAAGAPLGPGFVWRGFEPRPPRPGDPPRTDPALADSPLADPPVDPPGDPSPPWDSPEPPASPDSSGVSGPPGSSTDAASASSTAVSYSATVPNAAIPAEAASARVPRSGVTIARSRPYACASRASSRKLIREVAIRDPIGSTIASRGSGDSRIRAAALVISSSTSR